LSLFEEVELLIFGEIPNYLFVGYRTLSETSPIVDYRAGDAGGGEAAQLTLVTRRAIYPASAGD
jgi:hypothetical protein